jgi:hypothetical protein
MIVVYSLLLGIMTSVLIYRLIVQGRIQPERYRINTFCEKFEWCGNRMIMWSPWHHSRRLCEQCEDDWGPAVGGTVRIWS